METTLVTGTVRLPTGQIPTSGYVEFVMSGWDTDGALIVPHAVRAEIVDGAISVSLWPNARGWRSAWYDVRAVVPAPALGAPSGGATGVRLGRITVPEAEAADLAELLLIPPLPGLTATVILTQAEYNALPAPDPLTLYLIVED